MGSQQQCVCGSGLKFSDCCESVINGSRPAATAEELMRSRYTANVLRKSRYLLDCWHDATRPEGLDSSTLPQWVRLEIVDTLDGKTTDDKGIVEFKATCLQKKGFAVLHERSRFVRQDGKWFYVDGDILMNRELHSGAIGRNTTCPCGSGRKYKKCCLRKH